ncbi:MAG: Arc family DNA-binding protein [Deltaproteobacteria bacterium]|nr:Arc family DNA-binding protein [Deltaproteobacteria bacterium]
MAGLLVKDLPDHLHVRLKERAASNRRSLSAELIMILEQVLDDRSSGPSLDSIDRLRVVGSRPLTQAVLDEARHEGRP